MAVKTITIDLEAYEMLARNKKPGESFSRLIKARFGPRRTGQDLRAAIRALQVSAKTLDAIDRQIRRRRSEPARAPKL
jgi:predicted CopG family antitoxin